MKKSLLIMALAASTLSASADKVVFIADGSQDFYNGDATKIVKLIGQPVTDATPMMGDFGKIHFSNQATRVSCFRMSKAATSKFVVTPNEGITIDKITLRQQNQDVANNANCAQLTGSTYDFDNQQQILTNISAPTEIGLDATQELRISWIEVEYSGTATQVAAPLFESEYPIVNADKTVKVTCSTPGATIEYSTDNENWVAYPAEGIALKEDCMIYTRASKEGMTPSQVNGCKFFTLPAGTLKAEFNFNTWATMPINPATGKPFCKDELIVDTSGAPADSDPLTVNSYIYLTSGPDTFEPLSLKSEDVTFTQSGANNRLYYSKTQGFAVNERYYTKSILNVEVPENCTIERIIFRGDLTNFNITDTKNVSGSTVSSGEFSQPYNTLYTFFWNPAESVNKFEFKAGQTLQSKKFQNFTGYLSNMHVFYKKNQQDGVADLTNDNAPVEYFNLQGVRVANPENGIFIRRQGSKVTKVVK